WIVETVNHHAIDLGFSAFNLQIDVFAEILGELAYQTREALEQFADRLHTGGQCGALQLGRIARSTIECFCQCCHECGSLSFDRKLCELFEQNGSLIGCLYRFAGDFEQSVELDRIDAYAVFLDAVLVATTATTFYAVPAAFGCGRCRSRCRWC